MKARYINIILCAILFAAILAGASPSAQGATPPKKETAGEQQPAFPTPEEAVAALIGAARAHDRQKIFALIGPGSAKWLPSGDAEVDREQWTRFLAAYDQKHAIDKVTGEKAILLVGDDNWPFPAPLIRHGNNWLFDARNGREEVLQRRIGRNELDAIQTLLAVVDAQHEYASGDLDGNGFHDYARRFIATPGKHDGLYWPVAEGETPSPLGPLVGNASAVQRRDGKKISPRDSYHGYRYRLLESQGKDAPGGAYGYRVGDKLIGGFAVIAYPEKQNASGIMTFIVSHNGVVYEKNLGTKSESQALRMKVFNPDSSWKKVE